MDHKYTLDEIDRMRTVLRRKHTPFQHQQTGSVYLPNNWRELELQQAAMLYARIEDELRTCMVGGVRPEELEEKYPERVAAV